MFTIISNRRHEKGISKRAAANMLLDLGLPITMRAVHTFLSSCIILKRESRVG